MRLNPPVLPLEQRILFSRVGMVSLCFSMRHTTSALINLLTAAWCPAPTRAKGNPIPGERREKRNKDATVIPLCPLKWLRLMATVSVPSDTERERKREWCRNGGFFHFIKSLLSKMTSCVQDRQTVRLQLGCPDSHLSQSMGFAPFGCICSVVRMLENPIRCAIPRARAQLALLELGPESEAGSARQGGLW